MKIIKIIILLISIIGTRTSNAQIEIQLSGSGNSIYYLSQMMGDKSYVLDSALVINGKIQFEWKENYNEGMFLLSNLNNRLPFIASKDPILLKINWPSSFDQISVIHSVNNQLWQEYIAKRDEVYHKLDVINSVIDAFESNTEYYELSIAEFIKQQNELIEWIDKVKATNANNLVARLISLDLNPIPEPTLSLKEQQDFVKNHWFDNIDWNDEVLIYSDLLTKKITAYLGFFANKNWSKSELETEFKMAVDLLLPKVRGNTKVYQFVLDYLITGFERYNFEEVIIHMATNHPVSEKYCSNKGDDALQRLERFKRMQVGEIAPDVNLFNLEGQQIQISKTSGKKKLILFWASWCPHCKTLITEIENWYNSTTSSVWELYAISLDNNKEDLDEFIKNQKLTIPIFCDFQGWDSTPAIDFNIYATPTMIVLDDNLVIKNKPVSIEEL